MKFWKELNIDFPIKSVTKQGKEKIKYLDIEASFDIETTSLYIEDKKQCFMYIWQFGIKDENYIYYGRTWEDFLKFLDVLKKKLDISEKNILIIYVHNLAFEFSFMNKLFQWGKVFASDSRKPIFARTIDGIEFRDSYILSAMSLQKVAENLINHSIKKLIGDLDYSLIRTEKTKLSELELKYCENDVIIILYYINEQIKQYGNIAKIPYTNTGRVRRFVKNNCLHSNKSHKKDSTGKLKRYRDLIKGMTINSSEEYLLLKNAFAGGFTHANINYVNKVMKNVSSIDFTSSYPAVMLSEKYPMKSGEKIQIKDKKDFEYNIENYCCIFIIKFNNICSNYSFDNYISKSKCIKISGEIENNGRVFSADELIIAITNEDYKIIKYMYNWESMEIGIFYRYKKAYLPLPIIKSILSLYEKKTTLKGIEGKEYEYMISKNMLNSIYGMCVTDIVRDENIFDGEWKKEKANIDEQIEKYNKEFGRFLFYPWGVFVTAYARKNLWQGIINVNDDYIYSDTDSIKMINYDSHIDYVNFYNNQVEKKIKNMCDTYGLDFNLIMPKNKKGIRKILGTWDYEGTYKKFKTLGAKRYLIFDDDFHLTCAGLSKSNGVNYMKKICNNDVKKIFEYFNDDLMIPAENTGKMTHTYIDNESDYIVKDYQGNITKIHSYGGTHLEKCEFTLSISKKFAEFIKNFANGYIEIGDTIDE